MGSGPQSQSSQGRVPATLKPLFRTTGANVQELQRNAPLDSFTQPFRPQFTTTTSLPTTGAGATTALALPPPAASAQTTAAVPTNQQTRVEERLNKLFGKQAKNQAKGKGSPRTDKKIAKNQAKLGRITASTPAPAISGAPLDSVGGVPDFSAASGAVPLRDVFRPKGEGIGESPAVQAQLKAFDKNVRPGIINQLGLAGLGRSTAAADAIADAQADMLTPLFTDELGREERSIGAEFQDFLRRQALGEQALFTPLGGFLPSTIGTGVSTSGGK